MKDEKIGEGLIRIGAISRAQVEDILCRQRGGDNRLFGEIACELGYVNDEAIQSYLDIKPGCKFQGNCHFYNMKEMNAGNLLLKERYCDQWPEKCAIYQYKSLGKPIPITLWPTGKLQVEMKER
jgi:hypothetical protein